MKKLLLGIIILTLSLPIFAQIDLPKPDFNPYRQGEPGLLSLNRFSMNHSMGFSAGVSSLGSGYYLSRYTNQINYAFSPKLNLELDLSLVNYGTTGAKLEFNSDNNTQVIPEFKLNYRPSDSMNLSIEFRQAAPWNQVYSPWSTENRPWYEEW